MKFSEIHIRDPFILPYEGVYYLYGSRMIGTGFSFRGTGLDVYTSTDLETWSAPRECFTPPADFWAAWDFWAPEVHCWQGAFYMFVSFRGEERRRGTQILRASSPLGPFVPISDGPVTPEAWDCLDGTFYVDEQGGPWMVFCHEWTQIGNGSVCALPLKRDLTGPAGEPAELFRAHDVPWVQPPEEKVTGYVTDGPFLWKTADGRLRMIWSSFSAPGCYAQAQAVSESGRITGPWKHADAPLAAADSGHGMLFRTPEGQLYLVLHRPNNSPMERPALLAVRETPEGFVLE